MNSKDELMNRGQTKQLPGGAFLTLYKGVSSCRIVRKFRKEEPELFLAGSQIYKDNDFIGAGKIIVRENSFGHIPAILGSIKPDVKVDVSVWMKDKLLTIYRNVEVNLMEEKVSCRVDGLEIAGIYDMGILIHEQHTHPDMLRHELFNMFRITPEGSTFLVSHKKKGSDSFVKSVATDYGITPSKIFKGHGGARLIKYDSVEAPHVEIPWRRFIYSPVPEIPLHFSTLPSLFSADSVDVGSNFLIQQILEKYPREDSVTIYDMACGYGAIGLSLAAAFQDSAVFMSDVDTRAVESTIINIEQNDLTSRSTVLLSDGAEKVNGQFDLVVSNPPLHIERQKLITMIVQAKRKVKKGKSMFMVIEDSRVSELIEILTPKVGHIKDVNQIPSHSILEISK